MCVGDSIPPVAEVYKRLTSLQSKVETPKGLAASRHASSTNGDAADQPTEGEAEEPDHSSAALATVRFYPSLARSLATPFPLPFTLPVSRPVMLTTPCARPSHTYDARRKPRNDDGDDGIC